MPKVKFSTLLSEVKGKSNGSVFSSNRSGAYFRTNRTGINKNSSKMGQAKNNLSTLSSSWRNLSDENQQAWRDATVLYPKVDNIGNVVIPSGYQLFMRLNGTLRAMNQELMPVPAVPREMPPIGTITENYPDYYQFNPNLVLDLNRRGITGEPLSVSMAGLMNDFDLSDFYAFAMRFSFGRQVVGMQVTQPAIVLFEFTDGITSTGRLSISRANSSMFTIEFSFTFNTYSATYIFDVPATEIGSNTHIALMNNIGTITGQFLMVNGVVYEAEPIQTGTYSYVSTDYDFYLSRSNMTNIAPYMISDFRRIYDAVTEDQMRLISMGYELHPPTTYVPMNEFFAVNELAWYGIEVVGSMLVNGNGTAPVALTPYSFCLVPLFSLEFENYGMAGLSARIFASPPISNGRRGALADFKMVGSFTWDTEKKWEVQKELKAIYGNVPGNSLVRWYVQILDTTNGAVDYTKQEVKPKEPRFKAGTELGTKVH